MPHCGARAKQLAPPARGAAGAQTRGPAALPPANITLVSVTDGSVQVVKTAQGISPTAFSPDGKHIVYSRREQTAPGASYSPTAAYFAVSTDGKTEIPLVPASYAAYGLRWTPDGRHIIFPSKRSGDPGLWSIRMADGKPEGEPELVRAGDIWPREFTRDGSLFYSSYISLRDVYVAGLDPTTGKLTSQPKLVNENFVGRGVGPVTWSPDGQTLLFWKLNQHPNPRTIVLHSFDTGEDRDLPVDQPGRGGPWFFPDGRSLMSPGPEAQNWRRLDARTGKTLESWKQATPGPGPLNSAFSRDPVVRFGFKKNQEIACEGDRCVYSLIRKDLRKDEDREISRFEHSRADRLDISVSPDDRQLAFVMRNPDGSQSFMIVPTAGGTPREVYRGGKGFLVGGTAWTKDGRHILAFSRRADRPVQYSLPVDGGEPESRRCQ